MHDIEQQPSQDDATTVKITALPPQEERQMARGAGATSMTKEPERPRRPFATRYLAAGGIVLLALAVIFSAVLLRGQPSSQPVTGAAPVQHQPSSQPILAQSGSITIIANAAAAGTTTTLYAWHAHNATLLWSSRIDGAVGDQPLVSDGVVYVDTTSDTTATLYALRESDGTQLWHYTSNGSSMSTPVVANGIVYVGTLEDKVLALRAGSGTLLWQYSDNGSGLLSPQLVDGVIYVTAIDESPGNVYAVRASDGGLLWHYSASDSLNGTVVFNGAAYVTSQDGTLTALSSSTGRQLWQRALGGGNIGTLWQPIQVFNDVLYVATTKMSEPTANTSDPLLQALAIGSLFWHNFQAVPARQAAPLKEGLSALYAIRASDGTTLWHFSMNNAKNGMVGWLSVEDGVVYASVMDFSTSNTSKGHVYALQSTTGSVLWHYDDNTTSPSSALLANGVIYVNASSQDSNDVVYALRARDGSRLWRRAIGQALYNAPIPNGAALYIEAADGSVYALRADNGAVERHYAAN